MADNKTVDNGGLTDIPVATDEVTYSGDTADVQIMRPVHVTGAEGSKTVTAITDANGQFVGGSVAHDVADVGNPIKIGGKGVAADPPSDVTANDRVNAWFRQSGALGVFLVDNTSASISTSAKTDALTNAQASLSITSHGFVFNGSTWDRIRGDILGVHVSRAATAATATLSNVAGSATSVTLLSLNTSRKGATIHNDSSAILYVKFGATASTTSYTVKMIADAYYEVPFGYTGLIDGIWASAAGSARITELT